MCMHASTPEDFHQAVCIVHGAMRALKDPTNLDRRQLDTMCAPDTVAVLLEAFRELEILWFHRDRNEAPSPFLRTMVHSALFFLLCHYPGEGFVCHFQDGSLWPGLLRTLVNRHLPPALGQQIGLTRAAYLRPPGETIERMVTAGREAYILYGSGVLPKRARQQMRGWARERASASREQEAAATMNAASFASAWEEDEPPSQRRRMISE